jgi:hypothetical protein
MLERYFVMPETIDRIRDSWEPPESPETLAHPRRVWKDDEQLLEWLDSL